MKCGSKMCGSCLVLFDLSGHPVLPECPQFDRIPPFGARHKRPGVSILPAHTVLVRIRTASMYVDPNPHLLLLLASSMRRISRDPRLAPRSSALQQPSDVLIHDKRDARAGKHPDDIRGQAAIEARYALVRPGVRDRGWDGAMMCACQHRVVLSKK